MEGIADPIGAFVPHGRLRTQGNGPTVAVKDLFDWAGLPTGAGNPDWLATHTIPTKDAAVLSALRQTGFILHGKTITDELAYSIHGDNAHYGTPVNTAAPGRVPGGSSSGSAAAVAAGLVDTALGTDTGGSVRVPAAYCGLFGLRTTHGAIDKSGLVPLAPSFDTVGWFGRSVSKLTLLADVLLPPQEKFLWAKTATLNLENFADAETMDAVGRAVLSLGYPTLDLAPVFEAHGGLEDLRKVYVTIQSWEAWQTHGAWISANQPVFSPAIAQRFVSASRVTAAEADAAREHLTSFRNALRTALGNDTVLVLPATEGPAPRLSESPSRVDEIRTRTMRLTCPAGLSGLPQLTIPFVGKDSLPRGVGLLGPADSDQALISLAGQVRL